MLQLKDGDPMPAAIGSENAHRQISVSAWMAVPSGASGRDAEMAWRRRKGNGLGDVLPLASVPPVAIRHPVRRPLIDHHGSDSGRFASWDRPELHRMLDHLREGDTVVVWKLDRLSRSLKDVLHIMEQIAQAGAGFRSITENIDTNTPAGRMMMQMVGAFAEVERAMIRERTSAGLAAARAEGRIGGRRKKLDPAKQREIAESVISGRKSGAEMARLYNVSQPTVSRIVAARRGSHP